MIRKILIKFVVVLMLVVTLFSTQAFATITNVSNNFINYVEPINDTIKGESSNFTVFIPESWRNSVNVYRQTGEVGDSYLEKLSFYYAPNGSGDTVNKSNDSLFLTITVYAKGQKINSNSENVIFKQDGYTFTSLVNSQNDYKGTTTRNEFNNLVENSKSKEFLKKYIYFNNTLNLSTTSRIYYKNSNNLSASYIDSDGVIYIPLREFAKTLDYSIRWYQTIKGCKITKNGKSDIVYQFSGSSAYQTKMINSRIYVTTNYLRDKWGLNIFVDKKNNVYIS